VCANWLHTRQASMAGARASTVREFCNFLPYGQEGPAFRPNILACSLSLCWVIPWQSMALHPVTRGWSLRFRVTPSSHIHRFMWICFIFIVILSTQLEVLFAMCKSGWCVLKYRWLKNPLVDKKWGFLWVKNKCMKASVITTTKCIKDHEGGASRQIFGVCWWVI